MKKTLSVLMMMALVFGAFAAAPAEAKKKKKKPKKVERTVEAEYDCPCGVRVMGRGPGFIINEYGGAVIPTVGTETFLKLKIDDASGQKVFAVLSQGDTDGDGFSDTFAEVCGETTEPVEMPGGSELQVFIYEGNCGTEPTPSIAFGGTITATLSNMP